MGLIRETAVNMTELHDRVAINDLLHRYGDGVNQRSAEIWGECWDVDAEWFLLGPDTIGGRQAIVAAWLEAMQMYREVTIFVSPGSLSIDGDSARGRSYTNEVGVMADGRDVRVQGSYEDHYRRRGGVWRFTYRKFTLRSSEHFAKLGDAF